MIYNNVEYLSLPQQVEKNKDDIATIKTDTAILASLMRFLIDTTTDRSW